MNKYYGFVTFYKNEDIKEGKIMNNDIIVYPNIEDSLRFFSINDDVVITKVSCDKCEDLLNSEYYGYFNMKKTDEVMIEKIYSYEDIISMMATGKMNEVKLLRFIDKFRINEEDKQRFRKLGCFVSNYLDLVQGEKEKTKVKKYGQNSNKGC